MMKSTMYAEALEALAKDEDMNTNGTPLDVHNSRLKTLLEAAVAAPKL
jgi:hypothetical protein